MRVRIALLCLVPAVVLSSSSAHAATFTVDRTDDVLSASACTAGAADCSLRGALIRANTAIGADVILVPAGTYVLSIAGAGEDNCASGDLDVRESVSIWGDTAATTVIDAAGVDRVLHLPVGFTLDLKRLTLRGASVTGDGGGLLNNGGTVAINDCVVTGNSANDGGGISSSGSFVARTSAISANHALGLGGGIHVSAGNTDIHDTSVSGNTANYGGGVFCQDGDVGLWNTTVSQNSALTDGGGLCGSFSCSNCTISANLAYHDGGGISGGWSTLLQSTLARNTAANQGGAVSGYIYPTNSIIDGSCSTSSWVISSGGNVESPGDTCGLDEPSDQSSVTAPALALGDLQDNGGPTATHALGPGSVAVDAAVGASCPLLDQRGYPRDVGPCDTGAYERGADPHLQFFEDFERYALDEFPTEGGWQLRAYGAGSAFQYVDDAHATSGAQSLHLVGRSNNPAYAFRALPMLPAMSVRARVFLDAFVSCGITDTVASLHLVEPGVANYGDVLLSCDGSIYAQDDTDLVQLMPYSAQTWYELRLDCDFDANTYSVWVDGVLRASGLPIPLGGPPEGVELTTSYGTPNPLAWWDDVEVLAAEPSVVFFDDFESGDTSAWSEAVP